MKADTLQMSLAVRGIRLFLQILETFSTIVAPKVASYQPLSVVVAVPYLLFVFNLLKTNSAVYSHKQVQMLGVNWAYCTIRSTERGQWEFNRDCVL